MTDSERSGGPIPGLTLQRIVTVTALFIVVYSGFTVAGNITRSYQLSQQTRALQQQIASDQAEYQRLDALRRYMQSDEFIEAAARQEGLVRPGDISIQVTAPTAEPTPQAPAAGAWWDRYFGP